MENKSKHIQIWPGGSRIKELEINEKNCKYIRESYYNCLRNKCYSLKCDRIASQFFLCSKYIFYKV